VTGLVRRYALRGVLGAVGLAVGVTSVLALREATLSTHQPIARDSRVAVVVESETSHRERGQTVDEMTQALFLTCRLEVNSDLVEPIVALEGDRDEGVFRAVLQPAFDETNERQFRGCLEDWTIDQLLVDVLHIEQISP
jgi:hypothetical protein